MDILILIFSLILGLCLGRSGRLPEKITGSMDRILMVLIYGLLLLVGVEVGTYRDIFSNLGSIGLKALLLSLGTAGGSGLLCMLILKRG